MESRRDRGTGAVLRDVATFITFKQYLPTGLGLVLTCSTPQIARKEETPILRREPACDYAQGPFKVISSISGARAYRKVN